MTRFQISLSYLGVLLAGALIGFFAGREYLKYELRSAVASAVSEIRGGSAAPALPPLAKSPSLAAPPAAAREKSPAQPPERSPVTVALVRKSFMPRNLDRDEFYEYITFELSVTNNISGRDLRAFDGVMRFTDLIDNDILATHLAINELIRAGQTIKWNGSLRYNQFSEDMRRLRDASADNLKIDFVLHKTLFTDGSEKTWGEPPP